MLLNRLATDMRLQTRLWLGTKSVEPLCLKEKESWVRLLRIANQYHIKVNDVKLLLDWSLSYVKPHSTTHNFISTTSSLLFTVHI